ncbi:MAG: acetyl-CoA C-acetyltransferase [Candidatus Hydrogenedentota bacterium]
MPNEAYVFDAIRTPRGRGKDDGSLHEVKPMDLLKNLYDALQSRNDLDTSQVDDVILGCVTPVQDQGSDIAKMSAQYAGWDIDVPGAQVNRFCASGLEAVNTAAMKVRSGWENLVVAGGVECMSQIPMGSDGGSMMSDPHVMNELKFVPQGIGADLIATIEGFSREDVDGFAVESQKRAAQAQEEGRFKSIIPVRNREGDIVLEKDEHPRAGSTVESLGGLRASFQQIGESMFDAVALAKYPEVEGITHVHTAANSSGIVDGAALTLLGSKEKGEELGLKPRARIRAAALVGTEPTIMLIGPGPATKKALKIAGMTINDIDLMEVNEAFAAVPMRFMKDMGLSDNEKINVNGGAIALGHPLGATGAMLLGSLIDELERQDKQTGLITLCVGGGMGIATIIERV